jgi:hypothetical protein
MAKGQNAFAVGDILDRLERAAKDVARSLDSMRDRVDRRRLEQARGDLEKALAQIDALLATASGGCASPPPAGEVS